MILLALLGLAWGSFLNVVIHRVPRDLNIVFPASACPACGIRIRPLDNIPLVSWLVLRGKCRHCRAPIPFFYFLVEILTPVSFLILYNRFGWSWFLGAACLWTAALIALAFIDFFHQILPDEITLPGILLVLIFAVFRTDISLRNALLGAVAGAGFLLLVYAAYLFLRKKEGLGMGDITLMIFIGAFLGLPGTILTLILASFTGALAGLLLILVRRKDLQFALPFGTFLAPAAFAALVWGEPLIRWYLGLFRPA